MWKRKASTLTALALTGLLFLFSPFLPQNQAPAGSSEALIRIWILEDEPAVSRWLKKQAARYEKQSGRRVYLRSASREEMKSALEGREDAYPPDLMVMQGLEETLLFRGYALIIRDNEAQRIIPQPTSALFFRPTITPSPSATPAPVPALPSLSPILIPSCLSISIKGAETSVNPLAEFAAGKAPAAILTAGQAEQLPFGYRAHSLENGEGMLPVHGKAMSADGAALLAFLQDRPCQQALSEYGLYSFQKDLSLYDPANPIRHLIENSRN